LKEGKTLSNSAQIKRFILTGTPGSGKTSVIKDLEKRGYMVIHEAATNVISDAQINGVQNPWEHRHFIDLITHMQKERQMGHCKSCEAIHKNNTGSPRFARDDAQFYDRSPFCTYALCKYLAHWKGVEFKPSPVLLDEIDRCLKEGIYQNKVFFFENLGFIEHTAERLISYEEAIIFEQLHFDVYKEFGFNITMVPKGLTALQRADFILEHL
jgi:predicted ATPase